MDFKYLPAMLKANDGNMINTCINNNLIKNSLKAESGSFGPDALNIVRIPVIPKPTDAMMKIFVAIRCIPLSIPIYNNFRVSFSLLGGRLPRPSRDRFLSLYLSVKIGLREYKRDSTKTAYSLLSHESHLELVAQDILSLNL